MAAITVTSLVAGMSPQRIREVFTQDLGRAAGWVRLTALDGLAEGQLCYGRMLLDGNGVPRTSMRRLNGSNVLPAQGHIDAINMVGRCCDMGWGTPENPTAAAEHFRRAADSGHAWAQYNLGHLYLDGRGVERDRGLAYSYYLRAAEQGHPRAMSLVGRCCEEGWGRPRDPAAAASGMSDQPRVAISAASTTGRPTCWRWAALPRRHIGSSGPLKTARPLSGAQCCAQSQATPATPQWPHCCEVAASAHCAKRLS